MTAPVMPVEWRLIWVAERLAKNRRGYPSGGSICGQIRLEYDNFSQWTTPATAVLKLNGREMKSPLHGCKDWIKMGT